MKQLILLFCVLGLAFSCAKKEEDGGGSNSNITISGTMGTSKANGMRNHMAVAAVDLAAVKMYCVAFNASATSGASDFGNDGSFSLQIPANTPFGCFVVKKTDSSIVATLKVKDTGSGMSDESSSSMALKQDVSFGSITITEGSPTVEVPKATIAAAQSTTSATLGPDDVHASTWTLSCVDSGDSDCASFVSDSPQVYLRILKATKDGSNIYGLGVWASSTMFSNCGSQDMTTDEKTAIESDEDGSGVFTWTQNTATAATYSNATSDSSSCPKRDNADPNNKWESLQGYYAMNKLVVAGNVFTLNQEDDDSSGSCNYYHKTAVTFSPSSSTIMYGAFETAEIQTEDSSGDCAGSGGVKDDRASFVVKFTKQ